MRKFLILAGVIVSLVLLSAAWVLYTHTGQDWAMQRALASRLAAPGPDLTKPDALRVFVCGSSSPLIDPGRAQACLAVIAGKRIFVVDSGAGSDTVLQRANFPLQYLTGVMLTHFHSDHISALPDLNLAAWVAGHPGPLQIYGPQGVVTVVEGFNQAYALDRQYRTEHHGAQLLPAVGGRLLARVIRPGVVYDEDGLVITAFTVDHAPVTPALGYRFDFLGRSLVISGDSNAVETLAIVAQGTDLLFHDALSQSLINTLSSAMSAVGRDRIAKILSDILDYHASTESVAALALQSDVRQLVLYHLVPPPQNALVENIFRRNLPDEVILAEDGMLFELPGGSKEVEVRKLL